jgi:hypothetical protein
MKHLMHPDAFHKRIWMRLMNAFGRIRCLNASKRVWIYFWEKMILFAQIRTASLSISHDGQLFLEAYEQDKYFIFIHTFKLRSERG